MRKIVDYQIFTFDNIQTMADIVRIMISQLQPFGSPFAFKGKIFQAMVKYEDEKAGDYCSGVSYEDEKDHVYSEAELKYFDGIAKANRGNPTPEDKK